MYKLFQLWSRLQEDFVNCVEEKALAFEILNLLGVKYDPAKVSVMGRASGHGIGKPDEAPEGLTPSESMAPVRERTGAYRWTSPRGHHERKLVQWHAGSGVMLWVRGRFVRDYSLTSGEGMTSLEVYGPPGSWFQIHDSGSGEIRGYQFV